MAEGLRRLFVSGYRCLLVICTNLEVAEGWDAASVRRRTDGRKRRVIGLVMHFRLEELELGLSLGQIKSAVLSAAVVLCADGRFLA